MLISCCSFVVVVLFQPFIILSFVQILPRSQSQSSKPTIIDTDYGLFSDDIFALGIALGASPSTLDLQMIITTSHDAHLSARCAAHHISQTNRRIPVGVGVNGTAPSCTGHCCNPSFVGFNLRDDCSTGRYDSSDGVAFAATLLETSNRSDWVYVTLGPLSSLKSLADRFPHAARRIESVVMMGGNYCRGRTEDEAICPWEGYCAPFEELNVSCDVDAANFVAASEDWDLYVAGAIPGGNKLDRDAIAQLAARSGSSRGAMAVMNMFRLWNEAQCRIEDSVVPNIDIPSCQRPLVTSNMMNDGTAVMLAIQLIQHSKRKWLDFYDLPGMQFTSSGMTSLPDTLDDATDVDEPPPGDGCPRFVDERFGVDERDKLGDEQRRRRRRRPLKVLVGFESEEQRVDYFRWQLAYIENDDDDDPTCV